MIHIVVKLNNYHTFFFFQAEDGIRYPLVTGGSDVCSSDLARVEARLKAEELSKRMVEEFAIDPDEVLKEYLPDEATLATLAEADPRRQQTTDLRRTATALDRRLTLLGRVNPLALEEFKALEERYA